VLCAGARYPRERSVSRPFVLLVATLLALSACTSEGSGRGTGIASPTASGADPSSTPGLTAPSRTLRYVAMGDGYTAGVGTAAPKRQSWPAQLAQAMSSGEVGLQLVANLAENGSSSVEVEQVQLPQVEAKAPDIVTLQVGGSDILYSITLPEYRANLARILDELLDILPAERIFLVTTPDHTLTERGAQRPPGKVEGHAEVLEANAILAELAAQRHLTVIDISPVNQRAAHDPSLVAGKGPDPSAKQYAGWVEIIGPQMQRVLRDEEP
jgi:lysophospholipase L1-like esterase